jgi:DNA-binding NarL/FixJ family response regulator
VRILLADDHPLFREGVKPILEKLDPQVEILEAADFPAAFEAADRAPDLDLVLMDLNMPGMAGLEGVTRFRATFPVLPLVVLSAVEDLLDIQRVLAAGALGYLTKSTPSEGILDALLQVLAGNVYVPPNLVSSGVRMPPPRLGSPFPEFSERQLQVLSKLSQGLSNKQIGEMLEVTEGTVKVHMAAIFRILRVNNRTEALLVIQKLGMRLPD